MTSKIGFKKRVQIKSEAGFLLLCLPFITSPGLAQERVLKVESFPNNPLVIEPISNLQSEHWVRDLKIKVTNRSTKPIYYLNVGIAFPNIAGPPEDKHEPRYGDKYSFNLWWGQTRLVHKRIATPDDASIRPGESHFLTVPDDKWLACERYTTQKSVPQSATKNVVLVVWVVGFGDGTGFKDGEAFPLKAN
jgi:hypothetical protein